MTRGSRARPRLGAPPPMGEDEDSQGGTRGGRSWGRNRERAVQACVGMSMVLGPIVLLSLIAAAIVYVRLSHGPVSLKAFAGQIEQGINAELAGFHADIDDAVLTVGDSGTLEFRLINLRISETDGDLVASAPLAAVELSRSSLWVLRAVPERVYLIEPTISLVYSEKAGLALSFSDPEPKPADGSPLPPDGTAPPATPPPAGSASDAAPSPPPGATAETQTPAAPPAVPPASTFHRIDLARVLAEASARARAGIDATSKLREIGLRNATLLVDYGGRSSEWNIAEAAVDLEHMKRRSIVSGAARINSARGPWVVTFRAEDSEKKNSIRVTTSVQDLVPSTVAHSAPELALLETLDMPVKGEITLDLTTSGELKEAALGLELSQGVVHLPALTTAPLTIDQGKFDLAYDAAAHHLKVAPSTLRWGDSHLVVEGALTNVAGPDGTPQWHFGLAATDGVLAAEDFGVPAIKVESLVANGQLVPQDGTVEISEVKLVAGGAQVSASGEIITGGPLPSTRIEAAMTPATLATIKALWPRAIQPAARTWIGKHLTKGNLRSGTFKMLSGRFLSDADKTAPTAGAGPAGMRLSMAVDASDLEMIPLADGMLVRGPKALIRIENSALEVTVPDASVVVGPAREIPIKDGRFTIVDADTPAPVGELAFRSQTSLGAVLEAVTAAHLNLAEMPAIPTDVIDGKVDGQFKVTMPLVGTTPPKVEGKARITEVRTKQKLGPLEIQGGTVDVDISQTGVIATGQTLLNGVLAKLEVQRIFDMPPDMQPPMKLSATLDNADRTQLGLDVNHLVQGDMPVEVTLGRGAKDEPPAIHVRADLTGTELAFHDLAWVKSPGRAAVLEFDVGASQTQALELQNFKIAGDDVAIEGWMSLDKANEVQEFYFPDFSLNVVSRLEVQGKLGANRVWAIKAKGSTYDGKDLFRTLLSLGQSSEEVIKPRHPSEGMDIDAQIDTVLGYSDVPMRAFKLKLSERRELMTALDVKATIDGDTPLTVVLRKGQGGATARQIYAESSDAGQTFKMVGFYPNVQGGALRLEVNLDAEGAAEKSGVLWVDHFRVLGDPIVSEVYSSVQATGPAPEGQAKGKGRQVAREVFDFDSMKVPFSVGHGQFVIEEGYVKGPVFGAHMRGKVDYNAHTLQLGGTYVPLQELSSAFCDIPIVGPVITGLGCEGIIGITYAIQGPMANPQVIVNPLSVFTPGIFRGIMEMTSPNPKVLPRNDGPKGAVEGRVRASSSPATGGGDSDAERADSSPGIDGWSSQTKPADVGKKSR